MMNEIKLIHVSQWGPWQYMVLIKINSLHYAHCVKLSSPSLS